MLRLLLTLMLGLAACRSSAPAPPVEALVGGRDTSALVLTQLKGVRDGDRFDARATFGDSLVVDLHFAVGVPTKLTGGTWSGLGASGTVQEKSTTFLGGQDGPPSIGGKFELLDSNNSPQYRINIPVRPVTRM